MVGELNSSPDSFHFTYLISYFFLSISSLYFLFLFPPGSLQLFTTMFKLNFNFNYIILFFTFLAPKVISTLNHKHSPSLFNPSNQTAQTCPSTIMLHSFSPFLATNHNFPFIPFLPSCLSHLQYHQSNSLLQTHKLCNWYLPPVACLIWETLLITRIRSEAVTYLLHDHSWTKYSTCSTHCRASQLAILWGSACNLILTWHWELHIYTHIN